MWDGVVIDADMFRHYSILWFCYFHCKTSHYLSPNSQQKHFKCSWKTCFCRNKHKFPHEIRLYLDDKIWPAHCSLLTCSPACRSEIAPQWHLFLRNRHVRGSQQEYTVAGLLSHSSAIRASISLNVVAPFVRLPFGLERRENPVQTIGG